MPWILHAFRVRSVSPVRRVALARAVSLVAVAVATTVFVAPPARADEPTAVDTENALQLFKDGKALREQGDLEGSLAKLRAAHALVETPITALELGRALLLSGKPIEAREVWLSVARIPVRKTETARGAEARVTSEKLAADARAKIATITLVVPPLDADAKVKIDGALLPPAAYAAPRLVDPGVHVVTVESSAGTTRAEVTVGEGGAETLTLEAPRAPAPVPVPVIVPVSPPSRAATPAPPVAPPPHDDSARRAAIGGGIAVAGVGVVVGTLTGAMTLSQASSLKSVCTADGRCPRAYEGDLSSAETLGTVSTVSFAVALAGGLFAAGAYFLWRPAPARSATWLPAPGGVVGTF